MKLKNKILKRHEFNIFPDMSVKEYDRIKLDIKCYGFDYVNHPIMLYDNRILDGWNRYRALTDLNIELKDEYFEPFKGNDDEAMALVLRSNKRRNITQEQWAFLLVQSKALLEKTKELVKKQAKEKQIEGGKNKVTPKMGEAKDRHKNETIDIVADILDTTPAQLAKAEKYEKENPVAFEHVAAGKTTTRKLNAEKKATALVTEAAKTVTVTDEILPEGEALAELTELDMLKLIKQARARIAKLKLDYVHTENNEPASSVNIRISDEIEKIQLKLGRKLTE